MTGASSGIGLETAVYLAKQGFRVYATMRDPSRKDRLEQKAARHGVQLPVLQLNVRDEESIDAAVQTIIERHETIYGVVNNAGIQIRGYFEDLSEREIRSVFETNVFGTMAVIRAVLPYMRVARQGRIVILTSIGGRLGTVALSAYSASKFALEGFGESLALEVAPFGIHVSLIAPATINTEIWASNRGIAEDGLNPNSPYYAWFLKSEQLADKLVKSSPVTPIDVAKVVYEALTVERPKLRYLVGRRASFLLAAQRYLPSRLFNRLYLGIVTQWVTRGVEQQSDMVEQVRS